MKIFIKSPNHKALSLQQFSTKPNVEEVGQQLDLEVGSAQPTQTAWPLSSTLKLIAKEKLLLKKLEVDMDLAH